MRCDEGYTCFYDTKAKSPKLSLETLFLVNQPTQFWNTFWPSLKCMDQRIEKELPLIVIMLVLSLVYMKAVAKVKTNDKAVRKKLTEVLLHDVKTDCIFEEFAVIRGKARADVVSISDNKIHAYEIKSDADNLDRLPAQVAHYGKVFTTVTLVVGAEHAVKALYIIPDWWGVTVAKAVRNTVDLYTIREPKHNTAIDYSLLSDLLHKDELVKLLNQHGEQNNYWTMSKLKLISEVKKVLSNERLIDSFSSVISQRSLSVSSRDYSSTLQKCDGSPIQQPSPKLFQV